MTQQTIDTLKATFTAMLPVHGLTTTDIAALTNGFSTKTGWSVEHHADYDGESSLLITPADDAAPTYMVTREKAGLVLAVFQDDKLWTAAIEQSAVGILRRFP